MPTMPTIRRLRAALAFFLLGAIAAMPCVLWSGESLAREIETLATGTGADENEALADALAKAVAQTNGVSSSVNISTGKIEARSNAKRTDSQGTTEASAQLQIGRTADARMQARGRVARYEVISTETMPDGKTSLTVKAFVIRHEAPVYLAPGSGTAKKRIAVLPAVARGARYDFFEPTSGAALADKLTGEIEASLMASNTVSLLDRSTLVASLSELGLVGSDLTGSAEKAKLRQIRGADLILMSAVHEARRSVQTWRLQSTGQVRASEDLLLEVELRAVVPATGELLLTKRVEVTDAIDAGDAMEQVAAIAAHDAILALTGKAPASDPRLGRRRELDPSVEPDGPRQSGVSLPADR